VGLLLTCSFRRYLVQIKAHSAGYIRSVSPASLYTS
jgi:hypothetical protein